MHIQIKPFIPIPYMDKVSQRDLTDCRFRQYVTKNTTFSLIDKLNGLLNLLCKCTAS